MSAYIVHPHTSIPTLRGADPQPMNSAPRAAAPAPADPDGMLSATQQIETAFAIGREQVRKLREDIVANQSRHFRAQQEAERRLREAQAREQQLCHQLESLKQEATRRERLLATEATAHRERSEALQRDLENALNQINEQRRENTKTIQAATSREEALKNDLISAQSSRDALRAELSQLRSKATQIREAYEKAVSEIELYKSSWARVLKMEQEARAHLAKKTDAETRIRALENRNIELLAEAKRRIRGLEAAHRTAHQQLLAQTAQAQKQAANADCALRAAEESRARIAELEKAAQTAATRTQYSDIPEIEI